MRDFETLEFCSVLNALSRFAKVGVKGHHKCTLTFSDMKTLVLNLLFFGVNIP